MFPNAKGSELFSVLATIDPASQAVGTVATGWISAGNHHSLLALVQSGVLGTGATLDAKLQQATDAELPARLEPFAEHAVRHFGEEDRWMEQTQFPARECHIDEHAAVLKSVREVQALLAQGHTGPCRRLAQELAQWFPGHADYLDSALAHWMCKQRLGGKPVVIRRDLNLRSAPPDAKN